MQVAKRKGPPLKGEEMNGGRSGESRVVRSGMEDAGEGKAGGSTARHGADDRVVDCR